MSNIKVFTEDILLEIGGNPANKGFDSIVCAVELLNEIPELKYDMAGLYRKIGEIRNSTPRSIERAIRHEKNLLLKMENAKLQEYFPAIGKTVPNSKFLCILNLQVNRKVEGDKCKLS